MITFTSLPAEDCTKLLDLPLGVLLRLFFLNKLLKPRPKDVSVFSLKDWYTLETLLIRVCLNALESSKGNWLTTRMVDYIERYLSEEKGLYENLLDFGFTTIVIIGSKGDATQDGESFAKSKSK